MLVALGAAPARAETGYVITQREGASRSQLTLAPSGLRFDALAPTRRKGPVKPQVGMIIRYGDLHLFLLDPERRSYDSLSLASATASYARELKAARKGQPSERLPGRPGAKRRKGQASLTRPRARLRALALTTRIGPIRARAYLLRAGRTRERLWYADAIPVPPANVRSLLARGTSSSSAGSFARALSSRAGRIPLRIDVPKGRGWRTVLRTTSIRRRAIAASSLRPPSGYRERSLLPSAKSASARAHAADIPGAPRRCGVASTFLPCIPLAAGPISAHPDIWAFYWGSHYKERTDFTSSINQALHNFVGDEFADPNSKDFWGPLGQYGVGRGRLLGSEIVDENPDDSVGSWNFFDVEWFVLTHRFGSDAPNYWWRFSDHDPILAIFVDQSEVNTAGWSGYHFFTPTEGLLFAFLAHPNMPWFIVKTPSVASLSRDRSSDAYRHAVDVTTERASHEYVEAATDPYPFLSWSDPLKVPIWEQGEIGDICSQGYIRPFAQNARVLKRSTAFSTYWSNAEGACVPESRPSVTVDLPADNSTVSWGVQVTFIAKGDDLFDGSLPETIYSWTSDRDGPLGQGRVINTTALTPGEHRISVTVTNSQGVTRTAAITLRVVALPPTVRIDSPADGTAVGVDQKLNLRGVAFDPHDGDVSATATWSVDGVPVGTGAKLLSHQITTQGSHTVTLSYTNAVGLSASASIKVNIGPATGKPTVLITDPPLLPQYDTRYVTPGVPFNLSAQASAQGVATITSYVWTSDRDGALGTGQTITQALSAGTHQVTVTVTDSLARTASDTIAIVSQPPVQ